MTTLDDILKTLTPVEQLKKLNEVFKMYTYRLKQMNGNESDYSQVWNERAEIRRKITVLEKQYGRINQ